MSEPGQIVSILAMELYKMAFGPEQAETVHMWGSDARMRAWIGCVEQAITFHRKSLEMQLQASMGNWQNDYMKLEKRRNLDNPGYVPGLSQE